MITRIMQKRTILFTSFDVNHRTITPVATLAATFNFKKRTVYIDLACAIALGTRKGETARLIVWFVYWCKAHGFKSIQLSATSEAHEKVKKPFDPYRTDGEDRYASRRYVSLISYYQRLRFVPIGRPRYNNWVMRIDLSKALPKNPARFPLDKGWMHPIDTRAHVRTTEVDDDDY